MTQVNLLRVVVASPGDVQAERDCIEMVAAEMNRGLADVLGLRLEVVRWETDAFPGFNRHGSQGQIDTASESSERDSARRWLMRHQAQSMRYGVPMIHGGRVATRKSWSISTNSLPFIHCRKRPSSGSL